MELIFIRHGKTQGNLEGRYVGRTDEPILPESRREILSRKMKNEYPPADIVFTSPMLRCIETARIIYPGQKLIEIPDFCECDFGEFEMKSYAELNGRADYQAWIDRGGKDPFPGGESMDMVRKRSMRGFYRAMELAFRESDLLADNMAVGFDRMAESSFPGPDRTQKSTSGGPDFIMEQLFAGADSLMGPANSAAFVVHGGTIMSILSTICGGDFYDYQTGNGECVTVTIESALM